MVQVEFSDLLFLTIDPLVDRELIVKNRKDSFFISFGNIDKFEEYGEDRYLELVRKRVDLFPEGYVIVKNKKLDNIGQLEIYIKKMDVKRIGRISLIYLKKSCRYSGFGVKLFEYAMNFFKKRSVEEVFLDVSKTNQPAIRFYEKMGFEICSSEEDCSLYKMCKNINLLI